MRTDVKNKNIQNFIKNNTGQIIYLSDNFVDVKYKNIPIKILKTRFFIWNSTENEYCHTFNRNKILVFSNIPDDLELKLDTNKYNL